MKIKIGIVGVSGYAGLELITLLLRHSDVEFVAAMDAAELAEKPLHELHPRLRNVCNLRTIPPDPVLIKDLHLDTVFLCTPDKVSYDLAPKMLALGIRVIDFSGAFRLKNAASYPIWYGFSHSDLGLLQSAVYGLPEWNAKTIVPAQLIANPGCYPTSVILALRPLARAGILTAGSDIFCDSKSGVTGAGRGAKPDLMFAEVAENFRAYSPVAHRHAPEMCQEIGWDIENFTFVPHLLPVPRGILSTIYLNFSRQIDAAEIEAEYNKCYSGSRFVRIIGGQALPELRGVTHTNFCDIAWRITHGGRRGIIFSAIDNLGKGASGQALQNFNLMHGLDESAGLL
jgi:N-acetyl-gamma-glutamyl-phosphate reductase